MKQLLRSVSVENASYHQESISHQDNISVWLKRISRIINLKVGWAREDDSIPIQMSTLLSWIQIMLYYHTDPYHYTLLENIFSIKVAARDARASIQKQLSALSVRLDWINEELVGHESALSQVRCRFALNSRTTTFCLKLTCQICGASDK